MFSRNWEDLNDQETKARTYLEAMHEHFNDAISKLDGILPIASHNKKSITANKMMLDAAKTMSGCYGPLG